MSNCNPLKGYPCRAGPCLKNTSSVGSPAWFQIQYYRTQKINKQVRMPSSQQLLRNKSLTVTRWLAQGENGTSMNAGGPGDNKHSFQVSTRAGIRGNKARTEKKGAKGVDKKHGSYARYLARKTGKVLRQETSETVVNRTAVIANKRTISKGPPSTQGLWSNTCCEQATDPSPQGRLPVA